MKDIELTDFDPRQTDELVRMWRESFEFGVGIKDPHPIQEQRDYFLTEVLSNNHVSVAQLGKCIVGFLASSSESISQLYVHVDHHRRGIGSMLVDFAKRESDGSLWLYTFQQNKIARRFYERHGFNAIEFGFEEMWQLPDVKYAWSKN